MTFFETWCQRFTPLLKQDFGFSDLDVAAILGNAGHESNGFQTLQERKPMVPGSRGGYGIMQWTGPRRRSYEAYCAKYKLDPADMMTNYKYLFIELKGDESRAVDKIKTVSGLEKKTENFMLTFLRPGIPHLDSRIVWAKKALAAIQSPNSVPDVPVSIPVQPVPQQTAKDTDISFWTLLLRLLGFIK